MEFLFITVLWLSLLTTAFQLPNDDFRHISYQDLQLSTNSFSQEGTTTYSQLLFDVARNQVLVGARDMLFRLSLPHLNLLENATWTSPLDKTETCLTKGQTEENCHNYIKVLLTNGKKVFACGTESFNPACTWREIESLSTVNEKVEGVAKCPYSPTSNTTALLSESGEYYFGGPTDFSGSDFAIYRSIERHNSIRTKQYDSMWLNEPQFVGSFEADKFVYFLFRETAVEYINCGKIVYARIARVCKNDPGGQVMLKDNWTTFIKARLNCSISGDYPFYYDEIQSMAYVNEENLLYVTFTTPENSIAGSAICAFNITAINNAFSGPFKYKKDVSSAWTQHDLKNQDHFECMSAPHSKNLIESSKYQLMDHAVQATTLKPLYESKLERFTHITVDVLSTKLHASVHVLFIATREGIIKKLSVLPRTEETCVVEVWNPVPNSNVPILSMQYLKDTNSIYIGTDTKLVRIPAHHCGRHVSKHTCLNAMDPYCGWNELRDMCTIAPNSDPLEKSWIQAVTSCPVLDAPVDGAWSSWSDWMPCNHRSLSDPDSNDECLCQIRQCNNPSPQNGGKLCSGNAISVSNCTVHGGWTAWSAWSECSATCGVAVKTRTRTCTNPAPAYRGRVCVGQDRSEVLCTGNPPCPVAIPTPQSGGWSIWGEWGQCSVNCGGGYKKRFRRCNNPPPSPGGADCKGNNIDYTNCNEHSCPDQKKVNTVTFNYTNSKNENVQRKFKYVCRAPVNSSGLIKLTHKEEVCSNKHCIEEIGSWSEWGPCSVTCGNGQQTRERHNHTQSRSCHIMPCKPEWGCWSEWSPCSTSCGWGIKKRFRKCLGIGCRGEDMQEEQCEAPPCSSLLGWGEWSSWSICDSNLLQYRKRNCQTNNPGPQICQGSSKESRPCLSTDMQNGILTGDLKETIISASYGEMSVYIMIGFIVGFIIGFFAHLVYYKKKHPPLPSSPHYMSAKSNPYIAVPFHERPSKRQSASTSNVLNNSTNGTIKSMKYDYDTIKRNSHGLNNGTTKMDILDDKFYE